MHDAAGPQALDAILRIDLLCLAYLIRGALEQPQMVERRRPEIVGEIEARIQLERPLALGQREIPVEVGFPRHGCARQVRFGKLRVQRQGALRLTIRPVSPRRDLRALRETQVHVRAGHREPRSRQRVGRVYGEGAVERGDGARVPSSEIRASSARPRRYHSNAAAFWVYRRYSRS